MSEKIDLYYVESIKHQRALGNTLLRNWWGPNRCGYTFSLNRAGKYTKEEADIICQRKRDCKAWPCGEVDAQAQKVLFLP